LHSKLSFLSSYASENSPLKQESGKHNAQTQAPNFDKGKNFTLLHYDDFDE